MVENLGTYGIAAALIAAVSHIIYIKSIVNGITKPSRITWFIWSILGILVATSYFKSGATTTLWVPIGEAVWYIIIAILSIKYGVGGWSQIDRIAIFGASLSGLLWYITGSPTIALTAAIGVDLMAAIPTIYKSYIDPESEEATAWVFTSFGSTLNLFALNTLAFSIVLYPAYMFFTNTLITLLIIRKKLFKKNL